MALTKELMWSGPMFGRADAFIYRITKDGSSTTLAMGHGATSRYCFAIGGVGEVPPVCWDSAGTLTLAAAGTNTYTVDVLVVM